jgi:putative tryptophan/tyrosine transport system substrate-binding protein
MRRRDFISLVGGAAGAWPLAVRAQPTMPVVGFLSFGLPDLQGARLRAFREGLKAFGYVDGQNLAIEWRWVGDHYEHLPAAAVDLVRRQVSLIATQGTPAVLAAKAATTTMPIVFLTGGDPIRLGIVASINRPGGNVTGVTFLLSEMATKQFGLLHDLLPKATVIGFLTNPNNPQANTQLRDVSTTVKALALKLVVVNASNAGEIDAAFSSLAQRVDALVMGADAVFTQQRDQLVALAARHAVPVMYNLREYVEAGGLMSYGSSITEVSRQGGMYVARILKGEKPADLPVMQTTKFEFLINLRTAKALGINVSDNLISLADEVIE